MRLLLVSGGSVGHLAPLVAVERAFRELQPDAETLFLCSDRLDEAAFLCNENVAYEVLPLPKRSISLPWTFVRNFLASWMHLRRFRPDMVFSKGGAVSVPCCLAARVRGIPIVLHESDAVMGRANRIVARWAEVMCMGMARGVTGDELPVTSVQNSKLETRNSKLVFTGNPIRSELSQGVRKEGLHITCFSGRRLVLLVIGGSQGAQAFNEAVVRNLDALLVHCDVLHLTGRGKVGAIPRSGYWSAEYAQAEMPHLYAIADVAVSRAGAGTIAELAANGIPSILVPIAGLAGDHQVRNAEIAAETGGCIHLPQERLEEDLVSTVVLLMDHLEERTKMAEAIGSLHHPEAARLIAEILSKRIASGIPTH